MAYISRKYLNVTQSQTYWYWVVHSSTYQAAIANRATADIMNIKISFGSVTLDGLGHREGIGRLESVTKEAQE